MTAFTLDKRLQIAVGMLEAIVRELEADPKRRAELEPVMERAAKLLAEVMKLGPT